VTTGQRRRPPAVCSQFPPFLTLACSSSRNCSCDRGPSGPHHRRRQDGGRRARETSHCPSCSLVTSPSPLPRESPGRA